MAGWLADARDRMKKKGTEGKFSGWAQSKGMSTGEAANKVMDAPKGKYSPAKRKEANFARNAMKASKNA